MRDLLAVARRLEGMTRHASVHAAGVVIAPRRLTEFVPLYRSQKDEGEITTQWAMKEIERVGLLKMDFLGLSTLTLLDDAVRHIEETTGTRIALDTLPLDDPKAYQIFQSGQTHGVFQFESSGMRDTLRKAKPQCLEDLIALNALYRPGPLRGGVVDDYIARKHGRVEIKYEVPAMEPALKETYGVIAYQEQVLRLARELAGFSLGEADELRRAMGKKDAAKMQAKRASFLEGCKANGISEKKATKIFEFIEYFAGYGFPKAHSTTYALLAYQTAYLKANYPRHFMAALLTIESQNSDKIALYLAECRDLGVPVLPPDINESQLQFTVQPEGVRFGLGAVKGAGEGAILSVLDTRREPRRPHRVAVRAGRARRSPAAQQESAGKPDQGGRVRLAGARRAEHVPGLAAAPAGRPRPRARPRQPAPEGSGSGAIAALRRRAGNARRRVRSRRVAGGASLVGDPGARLREGSLGSVHERASAAAIRAGAGGRRRQTAGRPGAVGPRLHDRRRRDRAPPAQDQAR